MAVNRLNSEIDFLVESERSRVWEELNAPDPFAEYMKVASKYVLVSASHISVAEDQLANAYHLLEGSPMQKAIGAYIEKLSDMRFELKSLAEKYERGIRE